MPLSLKKTGVSAVYGLVDIGTNILDTSMNSVNYFQTVTDWQRIVAFGAGAGLAHFSSGNMEEMGEVLAYSSLPLLEKTIYGAVKQYVLPSLPAATSATRMYSRGQPGMVVLKSSAPGGGSVSASQNVF